MRRTNVVLDETLLSKARSITGVRTIRGLIDHALRELVRHRRQRDILRLRGAVRWEGDLHAMRRARHRS